MLAPPATIRHPIPKHASPGGAPAVTEDRPLPPLHHRADPRDADASDRLWWLFDANASWVKGIARDLAIADVPFVLPLRRVERRKPNRTRYVVDEPIFGGYLFVCGDDEFARHDALAAVPGKLRLGIPVNRVVVPELVQTLAALFDALESGIAVGAAAPPRPGDKVRVTSGLLKDKVGVLVRDSHGGETFHLAMTGVIAGMVEVAVESWQCERIED